MTQDNDQYERDKAIPGSIPSSVREKGSEARIAEKRASTAWVHVDDLRELIEQWEAEIEPVGGLGQKHQTLADCADDLEEVIEQSHESK